MCTECIHMFRLFRRNLFHVTVWQTSRLTFSFAVELLLYLRTIPKVLTFYWTSATVIGLHSVAVPWLWVWLDSTPLHSTPLDKWWVNSLSVVQKQIRDILRQTRSPWSSGEILRPATSLPYDVRFLRSESKFSTAITYPIFIWFSEGEAHTSRTHAPLTNLPSECSEPTHISFAIFSRQTPIWSHDWPHFHSSSTLLAYQHFSCPRN